MNKQCLTLTSRIKEEIIELQNTVSRIELAWSRAETTNDDLYLDSVALNLHSFYSGLENIFELIAKTIDESIPQGESWHHELLKQMMTEINHVRPAIISHDSFVMLNEYRGFRHVVRNVYTFNLSYKKLAPLVNDLKNTFDSVKNELNEFIKFLDDMC